MRRKNGGTALVTNEIEILRHLGAVKAEVHGYEIVKANGSVAMSTIYRCLKRLEVRGLIIGRWTEPEDPMNRPVRKFKISSEGVDVLAEVAA